MSPAGPVWPLGPVTVLGAHMMIALVVAELGTRIPLAGYACQWGARLVNPTYGWFAGFAGLLRSAPWSVRPRSSGTSSTS